MNCIGRVFKLRCWCCLLSRFIVYACFSQFSLLSFVTLRSMQLQLQLHLSHQLRLVLHLVGHLLSPVTHSCCCCLSLDSRHASSCDIRFLAKYANSAADRGRRGLHYLEHFLKCTMRNNGRRGIACHFALLPPTPTYACDLASTWPKTGCPPAAAVFKSLCGTFFISLAQVICPTITLSASLTLPLSHSLALSSSLSVFILLICGCTFRRFAFGWVYVVCLVEVGSAFKTVALCSIWEGALDSVCCGKINKQPGSQLSGLSGILIELHSKNPRDAI